MKLVKTAHLLTLGIALSLCSTGCRKGIDRTTTIPGRTPGSLTDSAAGPRNLPNNDNAPPILPNSNPTPNLNPPDATTTSTPLPPPDSNIPVADGENFRDWTEDRDTFRDQTVYFDFDKHIVKASEIPKLEEVARRMKADFVGKAVRIEGHCDERGTEEYNRALGDRRALSVREKLVALGVDPKILPTISYGEEHPVDPAHNEGAYKKNRRGELILLTRPGAK